MIDQETVRTLALEFDEAVEQPHFERTSFRVRKKVFATMDEKKNIAVVKLSLVEQSIFCGIDKRAFYPVPGAWGTKGWTQIDLKRVDGEMFKDALTVSYRNTAPKKLAQKYADEKE